MHYRYIEPHFTGHRNCQMRRNRSGSLHLFEPVIEVHVSNIISRGVIVSIPFTIVIILDLQARWNTLRTEGAFIPSATTSDVNRR